MKTLPKRDGYTVQQPRNRPGDKIATGFAINRYLRLARETGIHPPKAKPRTGIAKQQSAPSTPLSRAENARKLSQMVDLIEQIIAMDSRYSGQPKTKSPWRNRRGASLAHRDP